MDRRSEVIGELCRRIASGTFGASCFRSGHVVGDANFLDPF